MLVPAKFCWVFIMQQLLYQALYKHDLSWSPELPFEVGKHYTIHMTNEDVELRAYSASDQ